MQKDAIHYGGWEHRDVHNIGGMIYVCSLLPSFLESLSNALRPLAKPHGARTDRARGDPETSLCSHPRVLRWIATLWRHVDRRQPRDMASSREHGADALDQRYRRHDFLGMSVVGLVLR
jgi:hypothetical protein